MKKKYKELVHNTSIFALGTFGSKILIFLIVPLYTHVLSTSEYGEIDLITATISLLIPFATMLIYEAAIRFLVGKESDEKTIFNNCVFVFVLGLILSIVLSPIILLLLGMIKYFLIFYILLALSAYNTIFGQFLRASGDNWAFSLSGIMNTFFTVFLNLLFLVIFKWGINGYLYALIIADIISDVYIFIKCSTTKKINLKYVNFDVLKKMLVFSLPLVPNNIMWWIMNAGDKYVINYFLGNSANGIFSISYKIPTIITMIFSIFMQAWQVSAIKESNDKERNAFYKDIFNFISIILIVASLLMITFIQPLFILIIGKDFISAWKFVPLLSVSTLINCYATFAGVVYIINKKSFRSFFTTFVGALTNLILNYILIRYIGLYGVAIGTLIGYLVVMIIRFIDYKESFNINLFSNKFLLLQLIVIIDAIQYTCLNNMIKYVLSFIFVIMVLFVFRNDILKIINMIFKKNISKKGR